MSSVSSGTKDLFVKYHNRTLILLEYYTWLNTENELKTCCCNSFIYSLFSGSVWHYRLFWQWRSQVRWLSPAETAEIITLQQQQNSVSVFDTILCVIINQECRPHTRPLWKSTTTKLSWRLDLWWGFVVMRHEEQSGKKWEMWSRSVVFCWLPRNYHKMYTVLNRLQKLSQFLQQ